MAKILLIEDEEIVARMYERALEFHGYEVIVALKGAEGIEKVKEIKPDLVLLDIMMPKPDGMEVLEKIKVDPEVSNIPIVMLTNLSDRESVKKAVSKGAKDYWVKSDVEVRRLDEKIKSILDEK